MGPSESVSREPRSQFCDHYKTHTAWTDSGLDGQDGTWRIEQDALGV